MPAKRALLLTLLLLLFILPLTITLSKKPTKTTSRGATEPPGPNEQKPPELRYVKNEIIVKLKEPKQFLPTNTIQTFSQLDKDKVPLALKELDQLEEIKSIKKVFQTVELPPNLNQPVLSSESLNPNTDKIFLVTFTKEIDLERLIPELIENPDVEYAEPNYLYKTAFAPNDPLYSDQWNLKKIELDKAWDLTLGPETSLVAVVDTGVDYRHPDLGACTLAQVNNNQCQKIAPGWNFVATSNDPKDDNDHGTHVAGIINALVNNNLGIASFDKNSHTRVIPLKAFRSNGTATGDAILSALDYALRAQAKVVNMSFGSPDRSFFFESMIQLGLDQGVVFVAAAGNESANVTQSYPAAYDGVIAVGATDGDDHRASFSNYGSKLGVSAPGTEILSLVPLDPPQADGPYLRMNGTSMATPHVAGLAALILSKNPGLTWQEVHNIIFNSSDDLGTPGFDNYFGYGRINAFKALAQMNSSTPTPLAKISNPTENLLLGRKFKVYGQAAGNNFESYALSYSSSPQCSSGTDGFQSTGVTIANPNQAVANDGLLAEVLLPTEVTNGKYCLKLNAKASGREATTITHFFLDGMIADGWPIPIGQNIANNIFRRHPVIGDTNNDQQEEIVLINYLETKLYTFDKNGLTLANFPANILGRPDNTPTVVAGKIFLSADRTFGQEIYGTIQARDGLTGTSPSSWTEPNWEDLELAPSADAVVLADINLDAQEDIIYRERFDTGGNSGQKIYIFSQSGYFLPGWENGVVIPNTSGGTDFADFSPLVGNLLGDINSTNELVINHTNWSDPQGQSSKNISVYDANGATISEFAISTDREDIFNAALGDIDHDGLDEIIILSNLYTGGGNYRRPKVSVWKGSGEKLWQYNLPDEMDAATTLALADFNNDAFPEIFALTYFHGIAVVLDKDGRPLRGFPDQTTDAFSAGSEYASIVKLKNGHLVIVQNVVSAEVSGIRATEYDPSNGQSRKLEDLDKNFNTIRQYLSFQPIAVDFPVSTDLNNDGKLEIVVSITKPFYENLTYVFETGLELALNGIEWSQYRNDAGHTGAYHSVPAPPPTNCRTCESFTGCLQGKTCMEICRTNPGQCESKTCEGEVCDCRAGAPEEYRCPN